MYPNKDEIMCLSGGVSTASKFPSINNIINVWVEDMENQD